MKNIYILASDYDIKLVKIKDVKEITNNVL